MDLAGRKGGLLRVSGQLAGFTSKALEDVVDERVHDRHTFLGDASVRVHLLEHLVDVRGVRLNALLGALLAGRLLWRLGGFLGRSLSLLTQIRRKEGSDNPNGRKYCEDITSLGQCAHFEHDNARIRSVVTMLPILRALWDCPRRNRALAPF